MSYESQAHTAQVEIMRHLLFKPQAAFAELQKQTGLSSDHFTFHVKKLIQEGYVEKSRSIVPFNTQRQGVRESNGH